MELPKCACGCGNRVSKIGNKFIAGHSSKGKFNAFYGKKHTEETKKRISKKAKGRKITEEAKRKISEKGKGRQFSNEAKKKLSKKKEKEKHPNWKGGIRLGKNGRVLIRVNKGKYKARARIEMERFLGRELAPTEIVHHINGDPSDDTIENLCITNRSKHVIGHHTGAKRSEETKRKIGEKSKKRKHTEETKKKISEALLKKAKKKKRRRKNDNS